MARTRKDVSDTELAILQHLWAHGPATIRQLTDALYEDATTAKYATVQKLLERLEGKRLVARERGQPAHRFRAAISREDLIGDRLEDMAAKLCGGSLTPLLLHLLRAEQFSPEERQELRAFLEQLRKNNKAEHPGP
jgi:BlaI family transcriptional regulator, penicillinase repressor